MIKPDSRLEKSSAWFAEPPFGLIRSGHSQCYASKTVAICKAVPLCGKGGNLSFPAIRKKRPIRSGSHCGPGDNTRSTPGLPHSEDRAFPGLHFPACRKTTKASGKDGHLFHFPIHYCRNLYAFFTFSHFLLLPTVIVGGW